MLLIVVTKSEYDTDTFTPGLSFTTGELPTRVAFANLLSLISKRGFTWPITLFSLTALSPPYVSGKAGKAQSG